MPSATGSYTPRPRPISPHALKRAIPDTHMKNFSLTLLGLLAAPLLLSALPTRDTLSFAPARGASISMTYEVINEMSMDDMAVLINGEENPMMPSIEMNMVTTNEFQFTDVYESMADGQPLRMQRTFETIKIDLSGETVMDMMGDTQEEELAGEGSSALEGLTVLFNLKDGEYQKTWPKDEEGNDELLEGLVEDVSLRTLLSTEEVAEGESWDIDPKALIELLAPGGNLAMDLEMTGGEDAMNMGPDADMMSNMREMLSGELEGTFTGKLSGYREVEGTRLAVIELEIEIDCTTDMVDQFREQMEESLPPEAGIEMDVSSVDVSYVFEGSGELLWDASSGHVAGLTMEAETAMSMEMMIGMDAGGQQMDMEMSMEMSGIIRVEVGVK